MLTGFVSFVGDDLSHFSVEKGQRLLEKLGVKVRSYSREKGEYRVEVDDKAMSKLDPLWGTFVWVLTPEAK
jgi:hypothetical protein